MMGAMQITVTLDSVDPERLAPFWADALGYSVAGSVHNYTLLRPADGDGPKFLIQRVPEAKATKNRMPSNRQRPTDAVARLRPWGRPHRRGRLLRERLPVDRDGGPRAERICVCSNAG